MLQQSNLFASVLPHRSSIFHINRDQIHKELKTQKTLTSLKELRKLKFIYLFKLFLLFRQTPANPKLYKFIRNCYFFVNRPISLDSFLRKYAQFMNFSVDSILGGKFKKYVLGREKKWNSFKFHQ